MGLLTKDLVDEAISYCLPTIRLLVAAHTWGPKGVVIAVDGPGLDEPFVHVMAELGHEAQWADEWPGKNFREIALTKLRLAKRSGTSTRKAVSEHPWLLEMGDYFYTGGVSEAGLVVAASGAFGDTDEAIAWIVVNAIWLLCQERIQILQAADIKHLTY